MQELALTDLWFICHPIYTRTLISTDPAALQQMHTHRAGDEISNNLFIDEHIELYS